MRETVALSVINRLIGVVVKFNAIIKIRMYNGLHERYHFILMAMEMNDALGVIWIVSLGSVLDSSMIDDQEVIYPCPFAFNFSSNMLVLFLVCFNLYYKKEDCFGGDVYFRLPVIIKSNNLHAVTLEGRWVR